ncbi:hypothetical protein ACFWE5_05465 [Cellulosimicrobium funkei]|uniref:hypothetical protein n=1 Tax=Cellulosimicrobium funkei TaxID=264251 RepID=UPI0036504119
MASSGAENSVWEKFDPAVWEEIKRKAPVRSSDSTEKRKKTHRGRMFALNAISMVAWLYVPIKLFVADVDRMAANATIPQVAWILDFRVFFVIVAVALFVLMFRRRHWWMLLFVVFWPFVVCFWYIPRFVYRRKSWTLAVGLIHAVTAAWHGLRFTIVAFAAAAIAFLTLATASSLWLVVPATVALVGIWWISLIRTVRYAVTPDRFVRSQQILTRKFLQSDIAWGTINVPPELRDETVERYNEAQVQNFVNRASIGLLYCKAGQFWAGRLDEYRRSPATILSSCFIVTGLFLFSVAIYGFANYALFQAAPGQYKAESEPTLATFFYYAFAASLISEIGAIQPSGVGAIALQMLCGLGTGIVLLVLALSIIFGIKQSRVDQESVETIDKMQSEARELEVRLSKEYDTTPEEFLVRISTLGSLWSRVIIFLSSEIPDADTSRT